MPSRDGIPDLPASLAGRAAKAAFVKRSARPGFGETEKEEAACPVAELNTGR